MDLEAARVLDALDRLGARIGRPLSVAAETASTNDDARRAAAAGAPHGATFVADAQTAGRGRGGHAWHSPAGENVYLSIVLRPRVAAAEIAPVTLAVGLAVARVIARVVRGRASVALKWPNDVFVDGRKIAGVLVEGQLRGERVASLVAGIGLNVRTRAFPDEIARRATSLAIVVGGSGAGAGVGAGLAVGAGAGVGAGERGAIGEATMTEGGAEELDRAMIAAALIAEVGGVVVMYEEAGLAPFLREIRDADFLVGRDVEVGELRGVGAGIDDAGRLLVRDAHGTVHSVASGEALLGGSLEACSIGDRSSS